MEAVRTLASLGRAAREKASLRVRQPLAMMKVAVPAAVRGAAFEALLPLLAEETNVKRIEVEASDADAGAAAREAEFRDAGEAVRRRGAGGGAGRDAPRPGRLLQLERGEPLAGCAMA